MPMLMPTGSSPFPLRTRTLDGVLRTARIIHGAMLVTIPIYAVIGESVPHPTKPIPDFVVYLLGGLALMELVAATLIRRFMVESTEGVLQTDPNEQRALFKWQNGQFVSFALCEAIALYGLVLRLVGGPRSYSLGFYAVGVVFLLLYTPRRP